jgi:hypothetical protein
MTIAENSNTSTEPASYDEAESSFGESPDERVRRLIEEELASSRADSNAPDRGTSPRMMFPNLSCYTLTRGQEDAMLEYLKKRVQQVSEEMGRDLVVGNSSWYSPSGVGRGGVNEDRERKFMVKRARFEMEFRDDIDWRAACSPKGSIFSKNNERYPAMSEVVTQRIARAINAFFGSSPWFGAEAQGIADEKLAALVQQHARWKFDRNGIEDAFKDAIKRSEVIGECVVKITSEKRSSYGYRRASVLVGDDGEMLTDPATGTFIEEGSLTPEQLLALGVPAPVFIVKKVGVETVSFSGVRAHPVNFRDFLCPLTAENVQDADIAAHIYDVPLAVLLDGYRRGEAAVMSGTESGAAKDPKPDSAMSNIPADFGDKMRALATVLRGFNALATNSAEAASGELLDAKGGDPDANGTPFGDQTQVVTAVECWVRGDFNGDGVEEQLVVIYDQKSGVPIFYDYAENWTADGLRPFGVVREDPVAGSWCGYGSVERFLATQQLIDLTWNRMSFAQSTSGTFKLLDVSGLLLSDEERRKLEAGEFDLFLNNGKVYMWNSANAVQPMSADSVLVTKPVIAVEQSDLYRQFQGHLQILYNSSGVASANDASAAGLDTVKTATGVRAIDAKGDELTSYNLTWLETSLKECMRKLLKTLYLYMDTAETFYFSDGNLTLSETMTPFFSRNVDFSVSLVMNKARGEQELNQATAAAGILQEYYAQDVATQYITAQIYRKRIGALNMSFQPESLVSPGARENLMRMLAQVQAAQAQGANVPLPKDAEELPELIETLSQQGFDLVTPLLGNAAPAAIASDGGEAGNAGGASVLADPGATQTAANARNAQGAGGTPPSPTPAPRA